MTVYIVWDGWHASIDAIFDSYDKAKDYFYSTHLDDVPYDYPEFISKYPDTWQEKYRSNPEIIEAYGCEDKIFACEVR